MVSDVCIFDGTGGSVGVMEFAAGYFVGCVMTGVVFLVIWWRMHK